MCVCVWRRGGGDSVREMGEAQARERLNAGRRIEGDEIKEEEAEGGEV